VHDAVHVGSRLAISAPRNHFKLNPQHQRVLLIAGGIGVTPIYAMAQDLHARGVPFELVYCARSAARMAYLEELRALCGDKLVTHADDEVGAVFDVTSLLSEQRWDGVYVCGPAPLLDQVTATTVGWADGTVVMERFSAPESVAAPGEAFTLALAQSGLETTVSPDESVLDAIERLGVAHPFSCREGICGTCESRVLSGEIDHRCAVLSQAEKDSQTVMMPCVSRCMGEKLTLDL
jgi:p-toluenesulfonate methyl-monooxygenase reductase component TsaB